MSGKRGDQPLEEGALDYTPEELLEFLEADFVDVDADPSFKERLRRRLWDLLQSRQRRDSESDC